MASVKITHITPRQVIAFHKHVNRDLSEHCWPYTGFLDKDGYGMFQIGSRSTRQTCRAHRVAFFLYYQVDPVDFQVLHRCDNPPCCNPIHLFTGTNQDNRDDCVRKGRQAVANNNGARLYPERIYRGEQIHRARLTECDVRDILIRLANNESQASIARYYHVVRGAVCAISKGRTWKHIQRNS